MSVSDIKSKKVPIILEKVNGRAFILFQRI